MDIKIKIAQKSDIPPGKAIIVFCDEINKEIALFNQEGKIYALNNLCPHREGPLGEGEIKDGIVTCPWHGWEFCIKSGACVNVEGYEAETFDIAVEGDDIYVVI